MKVPGDINLNGQHLLRKTETPGTDNNTKVWILKCGTCSLIYGSNATDAFQRKCPNCQKGKQGLEIPIERNGEDWSREEHIIAFDLYNRIPFGKIDMSNPQLHELAALLGRKVGSVSYKLANFSRLDPYHQARGIKGMSHGAKGEEDVWSEFRNQPDAFALESQILLSALSKKSLEEVAEIETDDLPPAGIEREALVKLRVNQSFFRRRILSAYDFRCCVTGLNIPPLLTASHILPWSQDQKNRLNPQNGLCLNAVHDRAFDRHMMWVEEDFVIRFAPCLLSATEKTEESVNWLTQFEGRQLILPDHFKPSLVFLKTHADLCQAKFG